jgi:hypothetical protein
MFPLACKHCGHEWNETFRHPILFEMFMRRLRTIACPECKASFRCIAVNFGRSQMVAEIDTAAKREQIEATR